MSSIDSSLIIYDQMRRVVINKSMDLSSIEEFTPSTLENFQITSVYPTNNKKMIHLNLSDYSYMVNPGREPASKFVTYHLELQEISDHFDYPSDTWANMLRDGQPTGSATLVPYTHRFLFDYSHNRSEFYTFWPEDSHIYVLDPAGFDTLRSIPVELPSELLTDTERDSLQEEYGAEDWDFVNELLPDNKTPADKLIIDHQNRIWLKLTLHSDKQEWIVLEQDGKPIFRTKFPKTGRVAHIADHHIGFRADDHLFSLYELKE